MCKILIFWRFCGCLANWATLCVREVYFPHNLSASSPSVGIPIMIKEENMRQVMVEQHQIGWRPFFGGFHSHKWGEIQHQHYVEIGSMKNGKRWHVQLAKKMMEIAWDMWEHRNGIKHSDESAANKTEHIYLNGKIKEEIHAGTQEVARSDRCHFELPEDYEETWTISERARAHNRGSRERGSGNQEFNKKKRDTNRQNTTYTEIYILGKKWELQRKRQRMHG